MNLDPTLRDQLAKTIHDATCPCVHFPDSHPTTRGWFFTAADKAAELLTAQPAPIVLPTVKEVREAIIAGTKLGGWGPHTAAQAALNLIASRVRHWVPVEPGTPIKAGTRVREDWDDQITEWTLGRELVMNPKRHYWFDSATVPAEPEDPRLAVVRDVLAELDDYDDRTPTGDALLILARLDEIRGRK